MRDPIRIDEVLEVIRIYWKQNPDLRLGQIVSNATQAAKEKELAPFSDHGDVWSDLVRRLIFNIEDQDLVKGINELTND